MPPTHRPHHHLLRQSRANQLNAVSPLASSQPPSCSAASANPKTSTATATAASSPLQLSQQLNPPSWETNPHTKARAREFGAGAAHSDPAAAPPPRHREEAPATVAVAGSPSTSSARVALTAFTAKLTGRAQLPGWDATSETTVVRLTSIIIPWAAVVAAPPASLSSTTGYLHLIPQQQQQQQLSQAGPARICWISAEVQFTPISRKPSARGPGASFLQKTISPISVGSRTTGAGTLNQESAGSSRI